MVGPQPREGSNSSFYIVLAVMPRPQRTPPICLTNRLPGYVTTGPTHPPIPSYHPGQYQVDQTNQHSLGVSSKLLMSTDETNCRNRSDIEESTLTALLSASIFSLTDQLTQSMAPDMDSFDLRPRTPHQ